MKRKQLNDEDQTCLVVSEGGSYYQEDAPEVPRALFRVRLTSLTGKRAFGTSLVTKEEAMYGHHLTLIQRDVAFREEWKVHTERFLGCLVRFNQSWHEFMKGVDDFTVYPSSFSVGLECIKHGVRISTKGESAQSLTASSYGKTIGVPKSMVKAFLNKDHPLIGGGLERNQKGFTPDYYRTDFVPYEYVWRGDGADAKEDPDWFRPMDGGHFCPIWTDDLLLALLDPSLHETVKALNTLWKNMRNKLRELKCPVERIELVSQPSSEFAKIHLSYKQLREKLDKEEEEEHD